MIVGGALEATNAEIYNKFIELAGGKEKAIIGVIRQSFKVLQAVCG